MKNGEFLFGMRPECIFLNTQLGDKNPFLHNVNLGALPKRSPRHKSSDLRDYESYPDLYWKLRSDTVCNPECMENEMIDRDLYRLQQATSLKLTSFDKILLQEPFRNWRGKAGDLLFFPVGNIKKQKKKRLNVTPEQSNEARNAGNLKSEPSGTFLEIQATPIRKTAFSGEKTKNWESANFKSVPTLESKHTEASDEISEGSDVLNDDVASFKCRRSAADIDDQGYDVSAKRKSGNSIASCRTYQSGRTASGRKEMVKAAVISVELGISEEHHPRKANLDNIFHGVQPNKDRSGSVEYLTKSKTDLTTNTPRDSDEGDNGTLENETVSTAEQGKTKSELAPRRDQLIAERSLSASSSFDKRPGTHKSSSLPLKAVQLEVFNERRKPKSASKSPFVGFTEVPGYKLDLFNYPPSKKPPVTQSARGDVDQKKSVRTNNETTRSVVRRSKSARPSHAATSAYLKISPCF